jgi:hypothetical protein
MMKTNIFRFSFVLIMLTTFALFSSATLAIPDLLVNVDIKPMSCPNPVNLKSKGILTVAVLGTADFDVYEIDLDSVRLSRADGVGFSVAPLAGPPGPGSALEDVGTPFDGELCDCHTSEGDGYLDLVLKFRTDETVAALGLDVVPLGVWPQLVLVGNLLDGTPFEGSDCVVIITISD